MLALAFVPNGVQESSLSNVLEEWFTNDSFRQGGLRYPLTNIEELNDLYLIGLAVPELSNELFDIKVERKQLSISTVNSSQEAAEKD